MPTKERQMQITIKQYKEATGKTEVDMKEVANFAVKQGWKLPTPKNPLDVLASEFSKAARDEIRYDELTRRPYRANHAIPGAIVGGHVQYHLWIDIDEAPRKPMLKSLIMRREQMVGDGLQLTLDADHWNRIHQEEEPIQIPLDFTDDVEWRKNAPDEYKKAS